MALSENLIFKVTKKEPELVRANAKTPTSKDHEIKRLSDIDDQEGLRFLQPSMFIYPPSPSKIDPVGTIRYGLAKALEAYYPLAGRLFEGPNRKLMVDCNNEGVVFVEAEADVKLEQLRDRTSPQFVFVPKLSSNLLKLYCNVPDSDVIIGDPLVFFQVTKFTCGGFILAITFNHTLQDAPGLLLFLTAIGEFAKGALKPSVAPVWRRDLLDARSPPKITCIHNEYDHNFLSEKSLKYPKDTFILTSIIFGPKEIQALHNQIPKGRFTSFDVITACLWKCRTIALEAHPDDIVRITLVVNLRYGTFGASLPQGYYGNVFASPAVVSKASTLYESPLEHIANLIQKTKREVNEEYIKSVADFMVIKGRPDLNDTWSFEVSDLRNGGYDKLDLGFGEPCFAGVPWANSLDSFYNNLKCDGREKGVLVTISLPSMAIEKFQFEVKKMTREPISKY
ncbi:alcohol acyl transferase 1 allele GSa-like [Andrographis paniculata]|uniref:alcohol acyl transferase 1 allele GSa-like n=1 Tax=Andrographis paniculata TaxID=175694 RepID=UPI0021E8FAFA|nr:alcohol acyl transferase 1 allele GSa-like [Andrographis paniculata]